MNYNLLKICLNYIIKIILFVISRITFKHRSIDDSRQGFVAICQAPEYIFPSRQVNRLCTEDCVRHGAPLTNRIKSGAVRNHVTRRVFLQRYTLAFCFRCNSESL